MLKSRRPVERIFGLKRVNPFCQLNLLEYQSPFINHIYIVPRDPPRVEDIIGCSGG